MFRSTETDGSNERNQSERTDESKLNERHNIIKINIIIGWQHSLVCVRRYCFGFDYAFNLQIKASYWLFFFHHHHNHFSVSLSRGYIVCAPRLHDNHCGNMLNEWNYGILNVPQRHTYYSVRDATRTENKRERKKRYETEYNALARRCTRSFTCRFIKVKPINFHTKDQQRAERHSIVNSHTHRKRQFDDDDDVETHLLNIWGPTIRKLTQQNWRNREINEQWKRERKREVITFGFNFRVVRIATLRKKRKKYINFDHIDELEAFEAMFNWK